MWSGEAKRRRGHSSDSGALLASAVLVRPRLSNPENDRAGGGVSPPPAAHRAQGGERGEREIPLAFTRALLCVLQKDMEGKKEKKKISSLNAWIRDLILPRSQSVVTLQTEWTFRQTI